MTPESPHPTPETYSTLEELTSAMQQMQHDPLAPAGTNTVIYRGNPTARLMIVGEAPGPQENRLGKPFVGPSGQLLDKILGAVNLDAERDTFITNAVFRMPPGEGGRSVRKPTAAEIEFYKPYLMRIIELIDPRILLLTGGVSMHAVLNETQRGITRMRGQWHQLGNRWVMPIFHPAYLLRNPARTPGSPKALMWQDIQAVRRKYDELDLSTPTR